MINEICKLHSKLDFDHELQCQTIKDDYVTIIMKDNILFKVNDHILRIVRPSGEVCLLNVDYIVTCYNCEVRRW